ncbi:hypothetical protein EXN66_Car017448 [Channa argus]|uniref:Uncharacterized protein n=1 Tax=Channa argus TaxID=215402 RepID=A0A6G1QGE1_CHAAH|nr:hypothetical protein EXN66_Car017448 [Channa argus]
MTSNQLSSGANSLWTDSTTNVGWLCETRCVRLEEKILNLVEIALCCYKDTHTHIHTHTHSRTVQQL